MCQFWAEALKSVQSTKLSSPVTVLVEAHTEMNSHQLDSLMGLGKARLHC